MVIQCYYFDCDMKLRIGHGIDVHELSRNIPLILGGVIIPYNFGSKGHSDGDVVLHSLVDAILGALALGDIGTFFPSNDPKYKNIESKIFLEFALKKMKEKKYSINNIDINIILESPKVNPYINKMKSNLSKLLSISNEDISIKATTTDKLGFIGHKKGIMSTSTILIREDGS